MTSTTLLSFRLLALILSMGVVGNFLVYSLNLNDAGEALSGWRNTSVNTRGSWVSGESLGKFIGVVSVEESSPVDNPGNGSEEPSAIGMFTYNGKTYRLTGLVVGSSSTAASLLADSGEVLRLAPGEKIPSGETIESITLNQVVLITSDGTRETAEIY
jgi:hypothetical protein